MPRSHVESARARPCIVCGKKSDACHIRSKGAGGGEEDWNLLSMCREHHSEQHRLGWSKFVSRHKVVEDELRRKGWRFERQLNITKLRRAQ